MRKQAAKKPDGEGAVAEQGDSEAAVEVDEAVVGEGPKEEEVARRAQIGLYGVPSEHQELLE